MDFADVKFEEELTPFEYMMFRADLDTRSRTSLMFIETLDEVPDIDRLRTQVDRTTRVAYRLRQHVVAPLVPLAPARWVIDPDFDLDYHFRRIALPQQGGLRALLDFAAVLHATPLDPGRPLWEVTLVENLQNGDAKAALLWKFSHTVTDGVGGMVLDSMIHQESRDFDHGPMPLVPVPEDVSAMDLTRGAVRRAPLTLVRGSAKRAGGLLNLTRHSLRHPVLSTSAVTGKVAEIRRLVGPPAVEPSPLLRRRSLNHRFDALDFPFADLRASAKAHECSVNDAYLAAVAGGLRRYHEAKGMPIEAMGVAMPVSIRTSGSAAGNQWSSVTLRVPIAETDVVKRMREVRAQVLTARSNSTFDPAKLVAPLVAWIPQALLAGAGTGNLGFDVQASNVPGHSSDRFIAGARILQTVPIGPLPGVAMMITMVTLSGQCSVGINYDTAAFADTDLFEAAMREGFEEVLEIGRSSKSPSPKPIANKRRTATSQGETS